MATREIKEEEVKRRKRRSSGIREGGQRSGTSSERGTGAWLSI